MTEAMTDQKSADWADVTARELVNGGFGLAHAGTDAGLTRSIAAALRSVKADTLREAAAEILNPAMREAYVLSGPRCLALAAEHVLALAATEPPAPLLLDALTAANARVARLEAALRRIAYGSQDHRGYMDENGHWWSAVEVARAVLAEAGGGGR